MTLPVARCGDCLYFSVFAQDQRYADEFPDDPSSRAGLCVIRAVPENKREDDWCGEFRHLELGGRFPQPPQFIKDPKDWTALEREVMGRLLAVPVQQWRFPTEPE